ncbi:MAG TPA: serine/threonine-protein kinase [Gemmataceae bacterium]|nr:serine/threonine-protein kinase [Gemmataceae bacterium]
MAAPQQIDRRAFLANVRQSGLLSEEELARAEQELPASPRGRTIARAFIEKGLLTRFQAERLLVGRTAGFLLGQYRILDQIGRGGMGRVFKAEHRTMGRIVALKVLTPDLLRTDRAQELFLREVRAAAQLVHPNIVTAYDANEIDGRYFLVLEFVDGPNLEQLVRQQGPLPVGQACDYLRQIAHGLQCAHVLGMVHRDVKPANILVQRRGLNGDEVGLVKISDFGLARLHNPNAADDFGSHPGTILTKDNTVMGTPDYLSPEQARNLHKTDIRSDLYSAGCTFYFLLTGQVLFPGGATLDKLIRHGTEKPPSVLDLRPEVPAEVAAILDKLLSKHPKERYQTPTELAAALEPFAVSGPTPWAPLPPTLDILEDSVQTSGVEDVNDSVFQASNELSALANTLAQDGAPTPLTGGSGKRKSRRMHVPVRRPSRWRLWLLLIGIAVVLGLTAAAGALLLLAGSHLFWR